MNPTPALAQFLGELGPNEKSGDENRALGFTVNGFIAVDDPSDVDVYSFQAPVGTEIWIDIDRTSNTLDAVVELITQNGSLLARAVDNSSLTSTPGVTARSHAARRAAGRRLLLDESARSRACASSCRERAAAWAPTSSACAATPQPVK